MKSYANAYDARSAMRPLPFTSHATPARGEKFVHCLLRPVFPDGKPAPAGFLYPGDAGFPSGKTGLNKQWTNFSPRAGVAWDVTGDGRMEIGRASCRERV